MKISSMKGWGAAVLVAVSTGVLVGCYPGEVTGVSDLDLVVTQFDEEYDFSSNRTWAMPDSIVHVCDFVEVSGCIELSRDNDAQVLAKIATEMSDLGYTRIPADEISDTNVPDVVLLTSALGVRTTVIYNWWPGWGWWGGWGWCPGCWGPGWGWGYPPAVGVSSYTTGTLVVSMIDPSAEPSQDQNIVTPWNGVVDGLLTSSPTAQRVDRGLTQMFAQSPYLKVGN